MPAPNCPFKLGGAALASARGNLAKPNTECDGQRCAIFIVTDSKNNIGSCALAIGAASLNYLQANIGGLVQSFIQPTPTPSETPAPATDDAPATVGASLRVVPTMEKSE